MLGDRLVALQFCCAHYSLDLMIIHDAGSEPFFSLEIDVAGTDENLG
jgi:hypothetical protein